MYSALLNTVALNEFSVNCDVEDELPVPTSSPATSSMWNFCGGLLSCIPSTFVPFTIPLKVTAQVIVLLARAPLDNCVDVTALFTISLELTAFACILAAVTELPAS